VKTKVIIGVLLTAASGLVSADEHTLVVWNPPDVRLNHVTKQAHRASQRHRIPSHSDLTASHRAATGSYREDHCISCARRGSQTQA